MASSASLPAAAVYLSLLLPLLLLSGGLVETTSATVYKVGDAAGWTTINMPNYTAWALSKTFHIGDTLLFEYNKQYHNVEQVTKADYKACEGGNPTAMYASGNDSIVLKTAGRYFFLCGFPSHCSLGQKVDVLVQKSSASATAKSPAGPPAAAPGPAAGGGSAGGSSPVGAAPTPAKNAASGGASGTVGAAAVALVACLTAGLL